MSSQSPEERLRELRDQVRHHEERYYVLNDPEIADAEFDALLKQLEALEAEHPGLVTPDSPTQRVAGRPSEGFHTVEHLQPMLSLDNTYSTDELRAFDERVRKGAQLGDAPVTYIAELKIDGLSIALTYADGALVRGATRGDGQRGEDVSVNVRTIRAVPLRLRKAPDGAFEVRGEVYSRAPRSSGRIASARPRATRCLRTRGTPPPAPCATSIRRRWRSAACSRSSTSWSRPPTLLTVAASRRTPPC